MMSLLRIGGSIVVWLLLWVLGQGLNSTDFSLATNLLNIHFIPLMGIGISIISVVYPAIVDMGVAKYSKANLYDRIFPLLIVGIILYISTWFTPTVIVAMVNSYYLGVAISYMFKIIGSQLGW